MIRFCAALLLVTAFAKGQSTAVTPGFQDIPINSTAINISVLSKSVSEGDVFFENAERNEKQGDLNDALTLFGKAAFEYNSQKKTSRYAAAMLRMSNVHLLLANYVEAEQVVLNVALKSYSKIGSRAGQMASYLQLAKIYFAANKLTQSMWFYSQQGILAKQLGSNSSHIESVIGIANIKIKKKEYALATKDFNSAETLSKKYQTRQFNQQIKQGRALIAERNGIKK